VCAMGMDRRTEGKQQMCENGENWSLRQRCQADRGRCYDGYRMRGAPAFVVAYSTLRKPSKASLDLPADEE
jgi:hypothetical protein